MAELTNSTGTLSRTRGSRGWPLSLRAVTETIALWQQRSRDRAALARADARLLRDMGISPSEAREEASKPFWRA